MPENSNNSKDRLNLKNFFIKLVAISIAIIVVINFLFNMMFAERLEKIDKILSPLLIISGKKDEVVPHSHSDKLFLKANNPKKNLFIDEAMHNNLYDFNIDKEVIEFNSLI